MPIYNAVIGEIDFKETRRYAGLQKAIDFDESMIRAACDDTLLLAEPKGIWNAYDYDCLSHKAADGTSTLVGKSIAKHLAGCEKIIIMAVTVGEAIETEITRRFEVGEYAHAVLMDAAATAAVEQTADELERAITQNIAARGYDLRPRFSPGYGDWPLTQQTEMMRLSGANEIGISLSEKFMLQPRKSVTAVVGLIKRSDGGDGNAKKKKSCADCDRLDCPSRRS